MKKVLIVIGGILVLALVCSPFISGLIMERIVRESFVNLNQRNAESGQDVRAEIVRYDRGFGSSEIEWRIRAGSLKALYNINEVVLIDRAQHGLSGITTKTSLEKNTWYADFIKGRLGGRDPLHITTTYKMTGGIETGIAVDAFTLQEGQQTVAVKPGRLAFACDREFRNFSSEGVWEGMEFAGKGAVAAVSAKSKLAFVAPFIWDGDFHLAIQNGWLNEEKSGERFALAGVKIDSVIGFDKERKTLSATAEYSAESLTAGTEKIGNIFARFGVKGLNAERYETFMKLYTASMQSLFADIAAAGDDPEKMKDALERQMAGMGLQLFAAGEKLLTNGLELQLSGLHLQLPEGEIKMDLLVRLKKDTTFAQFIPMVNQPKLALDILELKTAISLPEKLVDDAPLLYAPIYPGMQTGLFVKSGDLAKHTAETRDGKLILNDKEVLWQ